MESSSSNEIPISVLGSLRVTLPGRLLSHRGFVRAGEGYWAPMKIIINISLSEKKGSM